MAEFKGTYRNFFLRFGFKLSSILLVRMCAPEVHMFNLETAFKSEFLELALSVPLMRAGGLFCRLFSGGPG